MRPRILLIGGSLAVPSHTSALLRAIAAALATHGGEAVRWDLAERPLPVADPAYHARPEEHPSPVVRELVQLADAADGVVLASPTYHNSYSGLLKNALDLLAARHVEGKPVGLAANGGRLALTHAVDHLRQVVRGLRAVSIPTQVVTCSRDYAVRGDCYDLVGQDAIQRVARFAEELVWYAARLSRRSPGAAEQAAAATPAATDSRA